MIIDKVNYCSRNIISPIFVESYMLCGTGNDCISHFDWLHEWAGREAHGIVDVISWSISAKLCVRTCSVLSVEVVGARASAHTLLLFHFKCNWN